MRRVEGPKEDVFDSPAEMNRRYVLSEIARHMAGNISNCSVGKRPRTIEIDRDRFFLYPANAPRQAPSPMRSECVIEFGVAVDASPCLRAPIVFPPDIAMA